MDLPSHPCRDWGRREVCKDLAPEVCARLLSAGSSLQEPQEIVKVINCLSSRFLQGPRK